MRYKRILILHSFHYPGKRRDGTIFYERHARKVGINLAKTNLASTIVIESPTKRNFKKLTQHYDAKWILDLHNDLHPYDPQIKHLLAMLYFSYGNQSRKEKTRQWIKRNYVPTKQGIYPVSIVSKAYNKPKNFIGVELYPHNRVSKSAEFVKKFSKFLYTDQV